MTVASYSTGTCTSLANLVSSLQAAASAAGWTVSGGGISKGPLSMSVTTTGTTNAEVLRARATVAGVVSPADSCMLAGRFGGNVGGTSRDIVWPATYHIFIYTDPDLIVVALNHDSIYWQYLMFGIAKNLGSTGIGGVVPFQWSTFHGPVGTENVANLWNTPSDGVSNHLHNALPFGFNATGIAGEPSSSYAYLNEGAGFDARPTNLAFKWAPRLPDGSGLTEGVLTMMDNFPGGTMAVARRQPNLSNGDSVFAEMRVAIQRPDNFWSWAFEIPHIRLCRNDYYADGDTVTRGSDVWMIASCRRKDLTDRRASAQTLDRSGTYAFALLKSDS